MPLLELPDVTLHYDDTHATLQTPPTGPRAVPDAPPLLLVHGFLLTARVWESMTAFLDPGRRVVAADTRGHGRSGAAADYTLEGMVSDLVGLIDRLGLQRPVVVGSSLGAMAAIRLAITRPDLLSGAVLIGTPSHAMVAVSGFLEANRDFAAGLSAGPSDDVASNVASQIPSWFGELGSPAVTAWAVRQALEAQPGLGAFIDDLADCDPRPDLPGVTVPLHYVHGRHDPIPLEIVTEEVALTPGAILTVVDHAGHMPHVETPGWTAGLL